MSELRANTISDAAGTGPVTLTGQYAAKAWVNFNGTGTVAINEDGNVSSITDNGTGDYTVNFTTAMPDADYAVSGAANTLSANINAGLNVALLGSPPTLKSTSGVRIRTSVGTTEVDAVDISVLIFR